MNNSTGIMNPENQSPNTTSYSITGKAMLGSVVIIVVAVFIILCFQGYSRWMFSQLSRRHSIYLSSITSACVRNHGLDKSILKALPTFVYDSKTHDPLLECCVCLSEFQDSEEGRVLPKCTHAFHISCIDMWFQSHSNCPLCRQPVQLHVSDLEISSETIASVVESANSQPQFCNEKEREMGCSSSSFPVSASSPTCQKAPTELVGISVEEPIENRNDRSLVEMGSNSPGCDGPKSRVNGIHSLKRIFSV
ncbi:hypothetical protein K2173_004220 [Erythroxylum novogranatense]|uniref:RING-type E3 ubiquitin transferase n=1 Tax=Erythroxylum novogranatense TaxID=1862640 RepID=A0AAV8UB91_9ROSI|nr:hypothetical protein K2173_004220 [Erythroxylum novogranatense]